MPIFGKEYFKFKIFFFHQIYTAEEKRALDMYNSVARANKESHVIAQFQELSKQKQREIQRQKDEEEFGVRFGSTQFKTEKAE